MQFNFQKYLIKLEAYRESLKNVSKFSSHLYRGEARGRVGGAMAPLGFLLSHYLTPHVLINSKN
jgi:hypothetical protein